MKTSLIVVVMGIQAALAAAGPATLPTATAPASQPYAAQIQKLIDQLEADDWSTRQAAHDELIKYGEDAMAALTQAAKSPDGEVRSRAESAMKLIEDNRVSGPSLITLHMKNARPKDIIDALARQAFAKIDVEKSSVVERLTEDGADIDLDRVPFWDAVKQISPKIGMYPQQWGRKNMAFARNAGDPMAGPSCVAGPFLIVAQSISLSRSVQLSNGIASSSFGVNLMIFPEPKLRLLGNCNAKITEAVDDNGNALGNASQGWWSGSDGGNWGGRSVQVALDYPQKPGRKITRLKGSITFTVQTKSETLLIDNPLDVKGQSHVIAGATVELLQLTKSDGEGYELKLKVSSNGLPDDRWQQLQQSASSDLTLLDAKGVALRRSGGSSRGSDKILEITFVFNRNQFGDAVKPGEPVKLRWELATETRQIEVPFEFADLPMP